MWSDVSAAKPRTSRVSFADLSNEKDKPMSLRHYLPMTAILTLPVGAPTLYPGDCVQIPGGRMMTARVVQEISYDPPQFEVQLEACRVNARMVRENDEEGSSHP
jgi:hypothetical protein